MGGDNTKLGVATTPIELKDQPVRYLRQDIVLRSYSSKVWAQYYSDFASRPLYKVTMTIGIAKGVTAVHKKLEDYHRKKKDVMTKPFVCITSRGDDVLKSEKITTGSRVDWF